MTGAPVSANTFQLLLWNPSVEWLFSRSVSRARGWTSPFGWLPAEKDRNRPAPQRARSASARMLRAELPVQRKRTL
jgi:hypothetical protein